jgi:Arc/MetJ-type ribon-helix-helix transcriptional regulator
MRKTKTVSTIHVPYASTGNMFVASISFPPKIAKEIDTLVNTLGIASRSAYINNLVREDFAARGLSLSED